MEIKSVITRKPITKSDHKRDIQLSRLASIIPVLKKKIGYDVGSDKTSVRNAFMRGYKLKGQWTIVKNKEEQ